VGSYAYVKIQEILQRYTNEIRLASTTAEIKRFLDVMLKAGLDERGNVIISWDPSIWGYKRWEPSD
jgi:hypothetical protein